jgi:hypothetical protein
MCWMNSENKKSITPDNPIVLLKFVNDKHTILYIMSRSDLKNALDRSNEIKLTVRGRKSGQDIPRPVWFVHEGKTLYLLPVEGSETNWYKNVLKDPTLKISVDGQDITGKAKPITETNKVKEIVEKFKRKYSDSEVKKYYTKFDVCVEFEL